MTKKYIMVGHGAYGRVFVTIEYKDGRLSLTGVEGPGESGNRAGSCCGQIIDSLDNITQYADGWDKAMVMQLQLYWKRWHLNDMRAGSPEQEKFLRDNHIEYTYPDWYYTKVCEALAEAGLHPDANGYRYGSAWLKEDVPAHVIAWLFALPENNTIPKCWR